jgi:predicted nucleotidyltransferase
METTLTPPQRRALDAARRLVAEHLADLPRARVWLFGSFARGDHRQWSDIDIAIDNGGERLPDGRRAAIVDAFEESSIPWFVDVVDLAQAGPDYRREVEREGVLWRGPA